MFDIREHLGVDLKKPTIDVSDPVAAEFYRDTWVHHASINTTVYDKVSPSTYRKYVFSELILFATRQRSPL